MRSCDQMRISVTGQQSQNDGAAGSSPVRRISAKEHEMFSKIEIPHGWLVAFPRFENALQTLKKTHKYVDADWVKLDVDLQRIVFDKIASLANRKKRGRTQVVYGEHFTAVKGTNAQKRGAFGGLSILKRRYSSQGFSQREKVMMAQRPKPEQCDSCGRNNVKICWDHDHASESFRGWICSDCNSALGFAHDSVERLNKLATYLTNSLRQAPHAGAF